MKIEKRVLTEALRVLTKVVSQTSPEAVLRQVRFLGCGDTMAAMATDGNEVIALRLEAQTEGDVDFVVEYKELLNLLKVGQLTLMRQCNSPQSVKMPEPLGGRTLVTRSSHPIIRRNFPAIQP